MILRGYRDADRGPAPQGAGGLKSLRRRRNRHFRRPAPQGAGGLKFPLGPLGRQCGGPTPQGAGGLKSVAFAVAKIDACPAPQGAGGLKYHLSFTDSILRQSRPTRGGWIEIHVREPG